MKQSFTVLYNKEVNRKMSFKGDLALKTIDTLNESSIAYYFARYSLGLNYEMLPDDVVHQAKCFYWIHWASPSGDMMPRVVQFAKRWQVTGRAGRSYRIWLRSTCFNNQQWDPAHTWMSKFS
jgi:hypothetical protein